MHADAVGEKKAQRRLSMEQDNKNEQSIMLEHGGRQERDEIQYANWSLGLCDGCRYPRLCCFTFWCAPCRKALTSDRAGVMTCWKFLLLYLLLLATPFAIFIAASVYGAEHEGREPWWMYLLLALAWVVWFGTYAVDVLVRGIIRTRFQIAGDMCTDCALVTTRWCCTTCQEAHHVDRARSVADFV